MTKHISHFLFHGASRRHSEGWKLRHVSVQVLQHQSDILLINNSDTLFRLLISVFLSSLVPPHHIPLSSLFPLVILCTYKNADGAFGSRSNWIGCASVLARVSATERRVICGITSAALNCIERLTDLFYDCSMRYLTYQCYKARGPMKSVMFFSPNSVSFSFNLLKSFI